MSDVAATGFTTLIYTNHVKALRRVNKFASHVPLTCCYPAICQFTSEQHDADGVNSSQPPLLPTAISPQDAFKSDAEAATAFMNTTRFRYTLRRHTPEGVSSIAPQARIIIPPSSTTDPGVRMADLSQQERPTGKLTSISAPPQPHRIPTDASVIDHPMVPPSHRQWSLLPGPPADSSALALYHELRRCQQQQRFALTYAVLDPLQAVLASRHLYSLHLDSSTHSLIDGLSKHVGDTIGDHQTLDRVSAVYRLQVRQANKLREHTLRTTPFGSLPALSRPPSKVPLHMPSSCHDGCISDSSLTMTTSNLRDPISHLRSHHAHLSPPSSLTSSTSLRSEGTTSLSTPSTSPATSTNPSWDPLCPSHFPQFHHSPIIVDIGGSVSSGTSVPFLMDRVEQLVTAGASGLIIDDRRYGAAKLSSTSIANGKVLTTIHDQRQKLKAIRLQLDAMRSNALIFSRTSAMSAVYVAGDIDVTDQWFILGSTNTEQSSLREELAPRRSKPSLPPSLSSAIPATVYSTPASSLSPSTSTTSPSLFATTSTTPASVDPFSHPFDDSLRHTAHDPPYLPGLGPDEDQHDALSRTTNHLSSGLKHESAHSSRDTLNIINTNTTTNAGAPISTPTKLSRTNVPQPLGLSRAHMLWERRAGLKTYYEHVRDELIALNTDHKTKLDALAEWRTRAGGLFAEFIDIVDKSERETHLGAQPIISKERSWKGWSPMSLEEMRGLAESLGVTRYWCPDKARSSEGYYRVRGGAAYAAARSVSIAIDGDYSLLEEWDEGERAIKREEEKRKTSGGKENSDDGHESVSSDTIPSTESKAMVPMRNIRVNAALRPCGRSTIDLLWAHMPRPLLSHALQYAHCVQRALPGHMMAYGYTASSSLDVQAIDDLELTRLSIEIAQYGFVWQSVAFAGFHVSALGAERFSRSFAKDGVSAFLRDVQRKEHDHGVETLSHHVWSGAEAADTVYNALDGGDIRAEGSAARMIKRTKSGNGNNIKAHGSNNNGVGGDDDISQEHKVRPEDGTGRNRNDRSLDARDQVNQSDSYSRTGNRNSGNGSYNPEDDDEISESKEVKNGRRVGDRKKYTEREKHRMTARKRKPTEEQFAETLE